MDEDFGWVPSDAVAGYGAYRADWILRRYGLQFGVNDESAVLSAN